MTKFEITITTKHPNSLKVKDMLIDIASMLGCEVSWKEKR